MKKSLLNSNKKQIIIKTNKIIENLENMESRFFVNKEVMKEYQVKNLIQLGIKLIALLNNNKDWLTNETAMTTLYFHATNKFLKSL